LDFLTCPRRPFPNRISRKWSESLQAPGTHAGFDSHSTVFNAEVAECVILTIDVGGSEQAPDKKKDVKKEHDKPPHAVDDKANLT
jgi:hypothetical protein